MQPMYTKRLRTTAQSVEVLNGRFAIDLIAQRTTRQSGMSSSTYVFPYPAPTDLEEELSIDEGDILWTQADPDAENTDSMPLLASLSCAALSRTDAAFDADQPFDHKNNKHRAALMDSFTMFGVSNKSATYDPVGATNRARLEKPTVQVAGTRTAKHTGREDIKVGDTIMAYIPSDDDIVAAGRAAQRMVIWTEPIRANASSPVSLMSLYMAANETKPDGTFVVAFENLPGYLLRFRTLKTTLRDTNFSGPLADAGVFNAILRLGEAWQYFSKFVIGEALESAKPGQNFALMVR